MTDTPKLARPLPDGVSDTFAHPCSSCGGTVNVVDGQSAHTCQNAARSLGQLLTRAWWNGHDHAASAQRHENRPTDLLDEQD